MACWSDIGNTESPEGIGRRSAGMTRIASIVPRVGDNSMRGFSWEMWKAGEIVPPRDRPSQTCSRPGTTVQNSCLMMFRSRSTQRLP